MKKLIDSKTWDITSHAYIFLGTDITTTSEAKLLAQKAICQNPDLAPCGFCPACRKIERGTHPDVVEIFPTGASVKIEQVRGLILKLAEKPMESMRSIFIIHNADTMTPQAQNSLLKTLEEPIGDSICILLSDNLKKLLPTVVSRCQVLDFSELTKSPITEETRERIAHIMLLPLNKKGTTYIGQLVVELSEMEEKTQDILEYTASLYRDILVVKTNSSSALINSDLENIIKRAANVFSEASIVMAIDEVYGQIKATKSKGNANLMWYNLLVGLEEVV